MPGTLWLPVRRRSCAGSAIFSHHDYAATIAAMRAAGRTVFHRRHALQLIDRRLGWTSPHFIDSLHPLEIKVLIDLGRRPSCNRFGQRTVGAQPPSLEPSQLSMAVEWLLAKSLIAVQTETVTPIVSLTKIGELYFEKHSPIERVLAAARDAAGTGKRLTIQDIQARGGLEPSDVSKAVGRLKKEGAVLIIQGGCIESTGRRVRRLRRCEACCNSYMESPRELQQLHGSPAAGHSKTAVKRGNATRTVPGR